MRSGKYFSFSLLFCFFTFSPPALGQNFFPTELDLDSFENSYLHVELGNLDISRLLLEARRSSQDSSEEDITQLVERNISYIIFQRLNRDRLYIVPDGQYIVDRASEIYGALNRIEHLVQEGRIIPERKIGNPESLRILEELKQNARSLRKQFKTYFVELSVAEYEFKIRKKDDPGMLMSDYLDECENVSSELKFSLDRFFFNPSPGVMTVDDYSSYSVALLSRSLETLSETFAEELRR